MTTLREKERDDFLLPANQTLTLDASAGAGTMLRLASATGGPNLSRTAVDGETKVVGPFSTAAKFRLDCTRGTVTWSAAPADYLATDATAMNRVVKLTQAAYDALGPPDATTLYVVVG